MMKTIKRIANFDKTDWKHIGWLFRNIIKQFFKGEFSESYDAWMWIKIHCSYDSNRLKEDSK